MYLWENEIFDKNLSKHYQSKIYQNITRVID